MDLETNLVGRPLLTLHSLVAYAEDLAPQKNSCFSTEQFVSDLNNETSGLGELKDASIVDMHLFHSSIATDDSEISGCYVLVSILIPTNLYDDLKSMRPLWLRCERSLPQAASATELMRRVLLTGDTVIISYDVSHLQDTGSIHVLTCGFHSNMASMHHLVNLLGIIHQVSTNYKSPDQSCWWFAAVVFGSLKTLGGSPIPLPTNSPWLRRLGKYIGRETRDLSRSVLEKFIATYGGGQHQHHRWLLEPSREAFWNAEEFPYVPLQGLRNEMLPLSYKSLTLPLLPSSQGRTLTPGNSEPSEGNTAEQTEGSSLKPLSSVLGPSHSPSRKLFPGALRPAESHQVTEQHSDDRFQAGKRSASTLKAREAEAGAATRTADLDKAFDGAQLDDDCPLLVYVRVTSDWTHPTTLPEEMDRYLKLVPGDIIAVTEIPSTIDTDSTYQFWTGVRLNNSCWFGPKKFPSSFVQMIYFAGPPYPSVRDDPIQDVLKVCQLPTQWPGNLKLGPENLLDDETPALFLVNAIRETLTHTHAHNLGLKEGDIVAVLGLELGNPYWRGRIVSDEEEEEEEEEDEDEARAGAGAISALSGQFFRSDSVRLFDLDHRKTVSDEEAMTYKLKTTSSQQREFLIDMGPWIDDVPGCAFPTEEMIQTTGTGTIQPKYGKETTNVDLLTPLRLQKTPLRSSVVEGALNAQSDETVPIMRSPNIRAVLPLSKEEQHLHAETLSTRVLAQRKQQLGPNHTDTLTATIYLAKLYQSVMRYSDAETLYKNALAVQELQLGPHHPDTLTTAVGLAILYQSLGSYSEAETLCKRTLTGREHIFGIDHPDTLTAVVSLANVYRSQGRISDSEILLEQALARQAQQLGTHHRDTLATIVILTDLYRSQERFSEAEELYDRVLAGQEQQLGPSHRDTLNTVVNLANLHLLQGRYSVAEMLFDRALAGQEQQLGPSHRHTLITIVNLAILHHSQGRYSEAEMLFDRALAGQEQQLGPHHPDTLNTVVNLAMLYHAQGHYSEAEELYDRALAGQEKQLGPSHCDTLSTVVNLANLHHSQGRYSVAEMLYDRALAGQEQRLGPSHRHTLITIVNLAILHHSQGHYSEAEMLFDRALAGQEQRFGPHHRDTLNTVVNFAITYHSQGRYSEAEELYDRVLAGQEQQLGPFHRDTLNTIVILANLHHSQGRYSVAETLFNRALAGQEQQLGPHHPDTLNTVFNLASILKSQGRYSEAEILYERALAGQRQQLGPNHPDSSKTLVSLTDLLQ